MLLMHDTSSIIKILLAYHASFLRAQKMSHLKQYLAFKRCEKNRGGECMGKGMILPTYR